MDARYCTQNALDFGLCHDSWQFLWSLRTLKPSEITQIHPQDLLIKKDDGVEGLILRA